MLPASRLRPARSRSSGIGSGGVGSQSSPQSKGDTRLVTDEPPLPGVDRRAIIGVGTAGMHYGGPGWVKGQ